MTVSRPSSAPPHPLCTWVESRMFVSAFIFCHFNFLFSILTEMWGTLRGRSLPGVPGSSWEEAEPDPTPRTSTDDQILILLKIFVIRAPENILTQPAGMVLQPRWVGGLMKHLRQITGQEDATVEGLSSVLKLTNPANITNRQQRRRHLHRFTSLNTADIIAESWLVLSHGWCWVMVGAESGVWCRVMAGAESWLVLSHGCWTRFRSWL